MTICMGDPPSHYRLAHSLHMMPGEGHLVLCVCTSLCKEQDLGTILSVCGFS